MRVGPTDGPLRAFGPVLAPKPFLIVYHGRQDGSVALATGLT